ncbi:circadian clock KaiB family protein [Alkalilimnicola ehrlichii MLHE-1]|uniref:KaiB domain protein n=1 Tax=Alkalilimnicola ehrlichii (strain ATCC BAA-1101 / DSM 17681 / MLHE-1) TaxID=187272 RepID=Q0A874_ALKEH|nr:circadian clock KaiB family protein [Alkalilimnicola ehrlichii]ABI56963.1 KaiB domain protein [Alkalilimnicola ehrlichii MLHE-1]
MAERALLRLFISDHTDRSRRALANLERICAEELRGRYEIEIVDVLLDPQAAENEQVLATPTLIRELPRPMRRIIGDLADHDQVLRDLEIQPLVAGDGD